MKATTCIRKPLESLKKYRNGYRSVELEATDLAKDWKIDPTFKNKRRTKVKKNFDELLEDYRI